MGDLISRKALVETIVNTPSEVSGYNPVYLQGCITRQHEILDMIERMPTIEPPKGEWKQRTDFDADNNAIFECSNCLHGDVQAKGSEVPFCWYCGARMVKNNE